MTFPSRKKRPTTQPSTLPWKFARQLARIAAATVLPVALAAGAAHAQTAPIVESAETAFEVPPPAPPEKSDPIERLKNRSPRERWNARKAELDRSTETPTDLATPISHRPAAADNTNRDSQDGPVGLFGGPVDEGRSGFDTQLGYRPERIEPLAPADAGFGAGRSASAGNLNFPELAAPRGRVPVQSVRMSQPYPTRPTDPTPKRVTDILPYQDYEPDPTIRAEDPCRNLCPRPDGAPCDPAPDGRMPECPLEIKLSDAPFEGRAIPESVYTWEASNLWHNPLYFEDFALERYGHTHHDCVQPFVSTGKFTAQLLGLPYQMTIDPICKRMYTLGWYRPGECAPKKCYQVPWNTEAAAVQAGVTTGAFFLFP